jgi:hypothetical protein
MFGPLTILSKSINGSATFIGSSALWTFQLDLNFAASSILIARKTSSKETHVQSRHDSSQKREQSGPDCPLEHSASRFLNPLSST